MSSNFEGIPAQKDHFKEADIVALAEFRHGVHGKAICGFLERYANKLDGLFFELPVEFQEDIDEYMQAGTINENLQEMFAGAAAEGKPGVATDTQMVLRKAAELHIPVICFDATKDRRSGRKRSDDGYYFVEGECRDDDMSQNVLRRYRTNPGKYVVLIGAGHLMDRALNNGDFDSFGMRLKSSIGSRFAAIRLVERNEPVPSEYLRGTFDDTIIG